MIKQKQKIKINFCDYWDGFDAKSDIIYKILSTHYDVELSENPDFLFYSGFGIKHTFYKNCVKIFFTGECVVPNFNDCDYAIGFDDITFEDRYLKYTLSYYMPPRKNIKKNLVNRRFCNFIYSNFNMGEGAIIRQEFFKKLSEYKHIDAPGKVCHNMDAEELSERYANDWTSSKIKFLEKYKFTIAFENTRSNGYVTEKFFHPLKANSIPIYLGAPDIAKDFNSKAFINCCDYKDLDEVIEQIKYLDNNDEAYLKMLKEPVERKESRLKNQDKKLEKFLLNIISKGNNPFNKDGVGMQERYLRARLKQMYKKQDNLLQKIFSVKNEKIHDKKSKEITIFGMKIKFKKSLGRG